MYIVYVVCVLMIRHYLRRLYVINTASTQFDTNFKLNFIFSFYIKYSFQIVLFCHSWGEIHFPGFSPECWSEQVHHFELYSDWIRAHHIPVGQEWK